MLPHSNAGLMFLFREALKKERLSYGNLPQGGRGGKGVGLTQSITMIHIWYTRHQMCITGSITPENKGGGVRLLMEDFHK